MALFAATIALSAFLLFLVQPVIAKQILPWFGGSAAVWTTCLVFFQVALLAGYAYSDLVIRKLARRRQAQLHTVLVLASLAFLPITPSAALKPENADNPIGRILLLLAATIGLPYLILSTTGPLVQAWFARTYPRGQVYRLYALSNVASMLALLAYPPVIEPLATSSAQSLGWSAGYVAVRGARSRRRMARGTRRAADGGAAHVAGRAGAARLSRRRSSHSETRRANTPARYLRRQRPTPRRHACRHFGCCCRLSARCCCSRSPPTSLRTSPRSRFSGCCRWRST